MRAQLEVSMHAFIRRRIGITAILAVTVLFALEGVASAHAVFMTTTNGLRPSTTLQLHMYVPDELDPSLWNKEVEVKVPAGWTMRSCHGLVDWSCKVNVALPDGAHGIDFKNSGGVTDPNEDFYFTLTTPARAGTYSFPTVQRYSDGTLIRWVGPPDSGEPAPQLVVLPAGVAPSSAPPTTVNTAPPPGVTSSGSNTTAPSIKSTPSSAPSTTSAPNPSTTAPTSSGLSADAVAGIVIGALVIATGTAAAFWRRRQRPK